jgi:hypothetical protein
MEVRSEAAEVLQRQSTATVVLEDETCTVMSLCGHPSLQAPKGEEYPLTCCDGCPNFTTVPCSC